MSTLYDQIISQRGSLERLVARIPGFRGYQEKAARREADRMLRDYIAGEIATRITRFARMENRLLDIGGLAYMSKTRSTKDRIQLFHDRVKAAAPGYSAMWAAVKIGEEELEKVYAFDEAQIRYVEKLDNGLAALDKALNENNSIAIDEALAELDVIAHEANDAFSLREDVLTNLNKSL